MTKTIHKAYKFRLEPNEEQKSLLAKHFGCTRFVYNHFLSERKAQYDETHKSDNYYAQAKKLTELKKDEEYAWLNEINSQTLQHTEAKRKRAVDQYKTSTVASTGLVSCPLIKAVRNLRWQFDPPQPNTKTLRDCVRFFQQHAKTAQKSHKHSKSASVLPPLR